MKGFKLIQKKKRAFNKLFVSPICFSANTNYCEDLSPPSPDFWGKWWLLYVSFDYFFYFFQDKFDKRSLVTLTTFFRNYSESSAVYLQHNFHF
jgi:hypothetical protein